MARLYVYRGGGRFASVPLAVASPLDASQASRAVRACFVHWRDAKGSRFYVNGRRVAVA
ncbi:hypothetical protein DELTA_4 [Brevundimonas phage vB_BsubS-Delta]|jgi:hypothetical protein|nr:hypothetical protein DELTA_4 [Brevundimonas phage vB_BsubS-Delta]